MGAPAEGQSVESPAGPRTQRAGRRKWPDVPAQEWRWKLRLTLERRTEPHFPHPWTGSPDTGASERWGADWEFITPFTEEKRKHSHIV